MPTYLKAACASIALSCLALFLATATWAGPKEDVATASATWARALGEDDPDKVLPLYANDAVVGDPIAYGAGRPGRVAGLFCHVL
jgi:hypothetical protein